MAANSPCLVGLALAVIFVLHINADEVCRTGCNGVTPQHFKYSIGTTYKYNYDGKILVTLSSAEGQQTSTEVKATVLLTQLPDCNQVLRVQNIQVIGSDGKKHSQIPGIEKPVRLNFHDGHLEDHICAEPGDNQNSLNVKRAIASFFQANLKHSYETDVFGLCPTDVSSSLEGDTLIVHKSKNLNKCNYRESVKNDYITTSFNFDSEIKSSPVLNADYNSKQKIKNGILDQATVIENYLYVPFSAGKKGAKASVESKIQLTGTSKDNPAVKVSQPKSIIFENPHPVPTTKSNTHSVINAIKETAKTIDVVVGENTAKEFINLIRIFRASNKDDLLSAYNQVKAGVGFTDKVAAKKIFLDALLRAGTGEAIEVAIELLKNKELSEKEHALVYLGLSFARHATEKSLVAAAELLNQPNLPREAYLGIGALAGQFCREHPCQNNDALNKLTNKLISKLEDGKAANRKEENDIIFTLKALANIHHLNDNILNKITTIAQDKKQPNRLRVAALETYLADPCKDKLRDSALGILKDIQQDSEVRIKAYLALAQCPNDKVGNAIKNLLEHEPSYQVGGFIVSHIKNIRASANPDKELAKRHLGFIHVPSRFPVDFRKWSYNGEFSYNIGTLGLANSLESNVIYSQSSWLPRSTSWNLTGEVLGRTFNFLEISTRQENLDHLIEHYLGPKGLLRNKSLQDLWNTNGKPVKELVKKFTDKLRSSLRSRRDVTPEEIEQIGKQVQIKTSGLNKDLDLDLSVKTFGSELLFLNINDDVKKISPDAIIDKIVKKFNEGIDKAKHFDETFRSNLLLLDAELAYPTALGFPLRLTLEAASNVQVKASGAIDLKSLINGSPKDTVIKLALIPSANIEIVGRLTIDALVVENGLKVSSSLYTGTGADLTLELFNKGLDVKLGLPVDQQNIITANHEIVFQTRELGAKEINVPLKFSQSKEFSICVDHLSPFIGLSFCGDINGPNLSGKDIPVLPFPLAGDAKLAARIEKDDVSQYHFRGDIKNEPNNFGVKVLLEVIGKNHDKKLSTELEAFLMPDKYIKLKLVSPTKSGYAEARIVNSNNEKSLLVKLSHDTTEFYAKAGVSVQGGGAKTIYKPLLEYKTPGQNSAQVPPYHVEGQVIVESSGPNDKYTLDNIRLVIPNQKPITLSGNFGHNNQDFFADLTLGDGGMSGSFKGHALFATHLLTYNGEFQNNINPNVNFKVEGEIKHDPDKKLEHSSQLIHGPDPNSKLNKLNVANTFKYKRSGEKFDIETKNKITYPLLKVDSKFDFILSPKKVEYDLDLKFNNIKLGSELEAKHDNGNCEVEFEIWGLDNKVELKTTRKVIGNDESKIDVSLAVNSKKLEVNGKVKHHFKPQDVDVGSDLVIKLPNHGAPFKVHNVLVYNPSKLDAALKISSGGAVYCDSYWKSNRAGTVDSNIKIDLKDALAVNGQIKATKGVGKGDLLVDLKSLKKSVKIESAFTVQDPIFNFDVTLYPIYSEDKTKKIFVSTKNKCTLEEVDSKNIIDILDHKFELNAKAFKQGEYTNGKRELEIDVTLPNQHWIGAKVNINRKVIDGVVNGNALATLEHRKNKNSVGRKLSLKGQARNTKPSEHIYDLEYNFVADDGNGKNLNADLTFKRQPQGDKYAVDIKNKIHGSLLKHPLESSFSGEYKDWNGNYQGKSTYGPGNTINLKGSYTLHPEEGKPVAGDFDLELNSDSKVVKVFKIGGSGSIKRPQKPDDHIELKGSSHLYVEDQSPQHTIDLKTEGHLKLSEKNGQISATIKYGKVDPITISSSYACSEDKNGKKLHTDIALKYGKGQSAKADLQLVKHPEREIDIQFRLDTPDLKHKVTTVKLKAKRSDGGKKAESELVIGLDEKKWTWNTQLDTSELTPTFDSKYKDADGKLSRIYAKVNRVSKEKSAEIKVISEKLNYVFEFAIESEIESPNEFSLKITAHCPKLKLEHITLVAHNEPSSNADGRKLQVEVKSGKKVIVSGSANYNARDEHGKVIVEGSGTFKVNDQSQTANFKYTRRNLFQDKHGESGIETSLDASLGNKAIDSEFKVTNKQFRILNSYCEEKKQCTHIEIDSKTSADSISHYNHVLEIAVDLRKLGLTHEFGLKAVTNRKDYVLDHTVDLHFQSQTNSKYQYSVYFHPKEAGISLTTPKRIISLEGKLNVPHTIKNGGRVEGEVLFYLDKKNQPNQKSALTGWLEIDHANHKIDGEAKFTNPGLKRPLHATYHAVKPSNKEASDSLELDIFALPNQKIVITRKLKNIVRGETGVEFDHTVAVKSAGLSIDIGATEKLILDRKSYTAKYLYECHYKVGSNRYDSGLKLRTTPRELDLSAKFLNVDLLKFIAKAQLQRDHQSLDIEFSNVAITPTDAHFELKNFNTFKFIGSSKAKPSDKLEVASGLIPGQVADFRAELTKDGSKLPLVHYTLKLDEANFLKSDYAIDSKNIDVVLKQVKESLGEELKSLRSVGQTWSKEAGQEVNHLKDVAKKALPNLGPAKEYYATELKKIREEIVSDKTIGEVLDLLRNVFGAIAHSVSETFNHISDFVEKIVHAIHSAFGKTFEVIDKEILPKLKDISEKIIHTVVETLNQASEVLLAYAAKIAQIIERYQPEIKKISVALGELGQEVSRFTLKAYNTAKKILQEQWVKIEQELKALPIYEEIKIQYKQFIEHGLPSSETLVATLKDATATLQDAVVVPEIKQLIADISAYIEKKLKKQPVNDLEEITKIVDEIFSTIKKAIQAISKEGFAEGLQNYKVPLSFDFVSKLPRLVAARFSPLSYLFRNEIVGIPEFVVSLVNKPRNWLPPFPLVGIIIQGQHIFTFDGKHLTFPGNCKYLLARDALHGHFSIVGTYENGFLTEITLADKTDRVTIKKGGQLLFNGVNHEYPARKPNIAAYRTYDRIVLKSIAGAIIYCEEQLLGCSVKLSGFYHGEIRGLLGNGNNEPYDDFTAANGKIVTSEGEFGNSYKIGNCAPVAPVSHTGSHPHASCTKLFGWESPMRFCFPFVKPDNFKTACEHGLHNGIKDTEHAISLAYTYACNEHGIPVRLPEQFTTCTNGIKPVQIGEKFDVKTPGKAADVILLVDTIKSNEVIYKELVQPLVQQLTNELKTKGVTDIEYHIIAYGGEENQWPTHITVGSKLAFKGKAPNLKFTQKKDDKLSTGCPKVDSLVEVIRSTIHDLKLGLGLYLEAETYTEGLKYPFRAHALKTIIAVTGRPCEVGKFLPLQIARTLLFRKKEINLNLITPVNELKLKDTKHTKDVIGFNIENVFTLSEAKKKPEGSAEAHRELSYLDYCIDFTLQNRGNVFSSDNFLNNKPNRPKFVQIVAHNIADQMTSQVQELVCECKYVDSMTAENVCVAVKSKEVDV